MAEKDPLSQVYDAMWALLEASEDFCALVPKPYRIKYVDDATVDPAIPAYRFPEQSTRKPDEYPQVKIEPGGAPADMYCTSDATRVNERFNIWAITGDRRLYYLQGDIYQGILPLQWAILRAMMGWEDSMKLLSWNGRACFVTHCSVSDRQMRIGSPRLKEQAQPAKDDGWWLAWQGDVHMWFPSEGDNGLKE